MKKFTASLFLVLAFSALVSAVEVPEVVACVCEHRFCNVEFESENLDADQKNLENYYALVKEERVVPYITDDNGIAFLLVFRACVDDGTLYYQDQKVGPLVCFKERGSVCDVDYEELGLTGVIWVEQEDADYLIVGGKRGSLIGLEGGTFSQTITSSLPFEQISFDEKRRATYFIGKSETGSDFGQVRSSETEFYLRTGTGSEFRFHPPVTARIKALGMSAVMDYLVLEFSKGVLEKDTSYELEIPGHLSEFKVSSTNEWENQNAVFVPKELVATKTEVVEEKSGFEAIAVYGIKSITLETPYTLADETNARYGNLPSGSTVYDFKEPVRVTVELYTSGADWLVKDSKTSTQDMGLLVMEVDKIVFARGLEYQQVSEEHAAREPAVYLHDWENPADKIVVFRAEEDVLLNDYVFSGTDGKERETISPESNESVEVNNVFLGSEIACEDGFEIEFGDNQNVFSFKYNEYPLYAPVYFEENVLARYLKPVLATHFSWDGAQTLENAADALCANPSKTVEKRGVVFDSKKAPVVVDALKTIYAGPIIKIEATSLDDGGLKGRLEKLDGCEEEHSCLAIKYRLLRPADEVEFRVYHRPADPAAYLAFKGVTENELTAGGKKFLEKAAGDILKAGKSDVGIWEVFSFGDLNKLAKRQREYISFDEVEISVKQDSWTGLKEPKDYVVQVGGSESFIYRMHEAEDDEVFYALGKRPAERPEIFVTDNKGDQFREVVILKLEELKRSDAGEEAWGLGPGSYAIEAKATAGEYKETVFKTVNAVELKSEFVPDVTQYALKVKKETHAPDYYLKVEDLSEDKVGFKYAAPSEDPRWDTRFSYPEGVGQNKLFSLDDGGSVFTQCSDKQTICALTLKRSGLPGVEEVKAPEEKPKRGEPCTPPSEDPASEEAEFKIDGNDLIVNKKNLVCDQEEKQGLSVLCLRARENFNDEPNYENAIYRCIDLMSVKTPGEPCLLVRVPQALLGYKGVTECWPGHGYYEIVEDSPEKLVWREIKRSEERQCREDQRDSEGRFLCGGRWIGLHRVRLVYDVKAEAIAAPEIRDDRKLMRIEVTVEAKQKIVAAETPEELEVAKEEAKREIEAAGLEIAIEEELPLETKAEEPAEELAPVEAEAQPHVGIIDMAKPPEEFTEEIPLEAEPAVEPEPGEVQPLRGEGEVDVPIDGALATQAGEKLPFVGSRELAEDAAAREPVWVDVTVGDVTVPAEVKKVEPEKYEAEKQKEIEVPKKPAYSIDEDASDCRFTEGIDEYKFSFDIKVIESTGPFGTVYADVNVFDYFNVKLTNREVGVVSEEVSSLEWSVTKGAPPFDESKYLLGFQLELTQRDDKKDKAVFDKQAYIIENCRKLEKIVSEEEAIAQAFGKRELSVCTSISEGKALFDLSKALNELRTEGYAELKVSVYREDRKALVGAQTITSPEFSYGVSKLSEGAKIDVLVWGYKAIEAGTTWKAVHAASCTMPTISNAVSDFFKKIPGIMLLSSQSTLDPKLSQRRSQAYVAVCIRELESWYLVSNTGTSIRATKQNLLPSKAQFFVFFDKEEQLNLRDCASISKVTKTEAAPYQNTQDIIQAFAKDASLLTLQGLGLLDPEGGDSLVSCLGGLTKVKPVREASYPMDCVSRETLSERQREKMLSRIS